MPPCGPARPPANSAAWRTSRTWPSPQGFRLAWIETATTGEWEDFESGYQCDEEEWLAAHPGHPQAAEIRERLDQHRSLWLRGYYGILGQAYLTLVPVA